jgi:hypothetical protein
MTLEADARKVRNRRSKASQATAGVPKEKQGKETTSNLALTVLYPLFVAGLPANGFEASLPAYPPACSLKAIVLDQHWQAGSMGVPVAG